MLRALATAGALALILTGSLLPTPARAGQATVMLVIEPAKTSGKRWDIDNGADAVLCTREGCYRSEGPARAARYLPGKRALSPLAALNFVGKAGACTNKLSCIYRGVELPGSAVFLQPIDVDVDRHDRMQHRFAAVDTSCTLRKGELGCFRGIFTSEYSMWVVPEEIAAEAGPERLQAALRDALPEARLAYAEEFLGEEREALPSLVATFYHLVLGEDISKRCMRRFEIMSEAFALSGALARSDERAARLLVDYLEGGAEFTLLSSIRAEPRAFWALHDAIDHLNAIVSAERVRHDDNGRGIRLADQADAVELVVGADAFDAARELVDRCEGHDETDLSTLMPRDKS